MNSVKKIKDTSLKLTIQVASIVLILMAIIVTTEIIMRWFFHKSIMISVDFAAYGMGIACYWGAAQAIEHDDFVRIDAVFAHLQPRAKKVISIISDIILLIFNTDIMYYFFVLLRTTIIRNQKANNYYATPLSWPRSIMFLGIVAFEVYVICRLILNFAKESTTNDNKELNQDNKAELSESYENGGN